MNIIRHDEFYGSNTWKMRVREYDMDNGHDIAKYIARHPFAFPGGYELMALTDDGGALCRHCCFTEFFQIRTAYKGDGWNVVGLFSEAELDEPEHCDHCNHVIGGN